DRVTEAQAQPELGMDEHRVTDERLVLVGDAPVPAIVARPRELPIHPDAEARGLAHRVIFLTDIGVVDVTQLVARIKRDEEVAVAERKIARHGLVRRGAPGRVEVALRVCDHAAEVAALQEVGANERATDAETHDPGAEVVRNLVEVDVPGGDEWEMDQRAANIRD